MGFEQLGTNLDCGAAGALWERVEMLEPSIHYEVRKNHSGFPR